MIIPDYDSQASDVPVAEAVGFAKQADHHVDGDRDDGDEASSYSYFVCRPDAGQERSGYPVYEDGEQEQEMDL